MDVIKTEPESDEEEQCHRTRSEHWQSCVKQEDDITTPFTFCVVKSEIQDTYEDVKIEAQSDDMLLSVSPLQTNAMKYEEDVLGEQTESFVDEMYPETDVPSASLLCVTQIKLEEDPLETKCENEHIVEDRKINTESDDGTAMTSPIDYTEVKIEDSKFAVENKINVDDSNCKTEISLKSPWCEADPLEMKTNKKVVGSHKKRPYSCDDCNKSFTNLLNLHQHQHMNSAKSSYECDVCKKSFTKQCVLELHIRVHTGERLYSCDVCKKSFTCQHHLTRHKRIHTGERTYLCDVCNKSFSNPDYLKSHQRVHTGERPYTCEVCKKSFPLRDTLTVHQRIHTGERPYVCDVCKKTFAQRSTLKNHQRIHTGERPYLCDVCKKSFSQRSYLKDHLRKHTGERPYTCDVCKKSFFEMVSLKRHQRVHTGERRYVCDVCKKAFFQHSHLKKHMRTHSI